MIAANPLSPFLPQALAMALDDEYRARATYGAVIAAHGPVAPFVNIVQAEQRHVDALLPLFARYGLMPPPDRWLGNVVPPATVPEACAAGVAAEIRNFRMYDALLEQIAEPDVRAVFWSLRTASAFHHLPAFARCAGQSLPAVTGITLPVQADLGRPGAATGTTALLGFAVGLGVVWWLARRVRGG